MPIRYSRGRFFVGRPPSPILRIGLAALCIGAWLGTTACDNLVPGGGESPTAPTAPPSAGSAIKYAAIGASDVAGVGSSAPCLTPFLDCPESKGYVFTAARDLRTRGFTVTLTNLGFPGAVISSRFQSLGRQYGRTDILLNFTDNLAPFVARDTTLVTIFAGANDVNVITGALGGGAGAGNPSAFIDQQVRNFAQDLATLLTAVRARAESSRMVVLNLPNVGALPYLAGASAAQRQAAQRAAVGMTVSAINPLVSEGVTVIDLMCDSRLYSRSAYSSDGLHPSDAGYAVMAGEVVRAVTSATYPRPQTSCPQMTIVP